MHAETEAWISKAEGDYIGASALAKNRSKKIAHLIVVYVEMNPLLPDPPQQDVIFLFERRVFRENCPF